MWERFSYYGMRALLVLFMVDSARGGLGMPDEIATSIYGLYTAGVYLAALPGGWIADRILGARRAVWYGGIIIALGHFTLAIPGVKPFFLGLLLVVVGTGLLKPNISAMVGELYAPGDTKRDAGFTIFYMGINLGAFLGPFVCSSLGEKVNWHYGFAAAGVGMVLGLVQYHFLQHRLAHAGLEPGNTAPLPRGGRYGLALAVGVALVFTFLALAGIIRLDPVTLARGTTTFIVGIAVVYFGYVLMLLKLERHEKLRIGVIIVLFFCSALFWSGFEQAGSSFNLFAERYTERMVRMVNFLVPTGWFQSLGPIFVITLAPVMAGLWTVLSRRRLEPSLPVKFGLGLILLGLGFLVMAVAAKMVGADRKVGPSWLVVTYLVHTVGELCVSPVGLSSVTRLSPRRLVGQMMGTWFLATSLGNLIAGLLAGTASGTGTGSMSGGFLAMLVIPAAAGVLLLLAAKPIQRMAGQDPPSTPG
jgi:POT family proton-dependent oligopeptide transporter